MKNKRDITSVLWSQLNVVLISPCIAMSWSLLNCLVLYFTSQELLQNLQECFEINFEDHRCGFKEKKIVETNSKQMDPAEHNVHA